MPELPEVEIARRTLVRWFEGHQVKRAEATKTRIFRGAKPQAFEAIRGPLTRAERKGKYLLLSFGEQGLLAHLGMTGKFLKRPPGEEVPYSRARFVLDSGEVIHFRDPRMFGRIEPAPAAKLWSLGVIQDLGVDPLTDGLDVERLKAAIGKSKQELKVALMDQGRITGLGNIHTSEALYRARLHPSRAPASLTGDEWKRLCEGIHAAIAYGLEEQGNVDEIQYVEEPGAPNPFLVYDRAGEECGNCNAVIEKSEHGGRSSYFCPECQPFVPGEPRIAAPRRVAVVRKKAKRKSKAKRSRT
ncbi:MAG: formamidopyrimidine-DNA glycosylase [Myxococcaceae bacterium]|nr:formamidopyrimidine-DNA glycosylase [Myxococcaceae bacterium]